MLIKMRYCRVVLLILLINCLCFRTVKGEFIGLLQDLVNVDFSKANISEECESGLVLIKNGLENREIWALKALDASSYLEGDFVWGNNMAPGSPRACDLVNKARKIFVGPKFVPKSYENITQIQSPIPLSYRVLHAKHHSRIQFDVQYLEKDVMDMAFCMPAACDGKDSERLFKIMLNDEHFLNNTLLENGLDLIRTKLLELSNDFYGNKFVQAFLGILIIMIGFTCIEIAIRVVRSCLLHKSSDSIQVEKRRKTLFEEFILCFSAVDNLKRIFIVTEKESNIPALDGLKVISMVFLIVGHLVIFGISAVSNFQHILTMTESPSIQLLISVHYCVDSFFVISGTLLSFSFSEYAKTNKVKNKLLVFIKMALRRYLRLTPTYLIHILLVIATTKLIQDFSVFYLLEDNTTKCENTWWKNILYINNYDLLEDTCLLWGYYLSNDFQLYLIGSAILLIYISNKSVGSTLYIVVLLASIITCGYYGYTLNYTPTFQSVAKTVPYLYNPVWARAPPYFMGILSGWFLSQRDRTLKINQYVVGICWALTGVIFLYLGLCGMNPEFSPEKSLFFAALSRLFWGIAMSWTIIACATNHGGFIQKLLTAKLFVLLNRLTFSVYLTNPVWSLLTTMLADRPFHLDFSMLPVTFIGFVITSYSAGLVFCILFESPFIRLYKLLGI